MPDPKLETIVQQLGLSRARSFHFLHSWLRHAEVAVGEKLMNAQTLECHVEIDGTGIRYYKDHAEGQNVHIAIRGFAQRPSHQHPGPIRTLLYLMVPRSVSQNSVCPVERKQDVIASAGLLKLAPGTVIADGARCYSDVALQHGFVHRSVAHCRGEWNRYENIGKGKLPLKVNTVLIDGVCGPS